MSILIQTKRLVLREFNSHLDGQSMFLLNHDPEVLKYTGDEPFDSVEDAKKFLEHYSDFKTNGYGRWIVMDIQTKEKLGWCG